MASRTIDIVAAGPPSADPYDPAASAWALAGAFALRGHSVQVAYPGPPEAPAVPAGVSTAPFPPVTAHVGTYLGDAELARSAARQLRSRSDVVIRDPAGLGPLGHHAGHRPLVAFVRTLSGNETSAPRSTSLAGGLRGKLLGWGERRGVRRLEKEALGEATMVCAATPALRDRLRTEYGVEAGRLRVAPSAVPVVADPSSREAARRLVGVPDDVPLVAVLPPADPAATVEAAGPALEAFRRTRPFFPGARLAVLGSPEATGPGVIALPSRAAEAINAAVHASDLAIAVTPGPGAPDPGIVVALRAGVATVVDPSVDLGEGGDGAVRRTALGDAGELASVVAELVADPEERRALGQRGRAYAERFAPERLAQELEGAGALGPA